MCRQSPRDKTRFSFFYARALSSKLLSVAVAILIAIPHSSNAQIGANPSDQLVQAQQQYLQRQSGTNAALPAVPQDTVIQPVQPGSVVVLPTSRLEQIMSTRAGAHLQQFGYNQMGSGRAVTVPQTGAIQDDYILGPNDEIVVSLRGQENNEFRTIVDRNGRVVLPRLNPISASGRDLGSFRRDVQAAVQVAYISTTAFVTVGRVRQISVMVSGEVNYPGQRLMTGLSSTLDALLLSGGVKKTGSLRNVRVNRGGREYTVDLYSVVTNRAVSSNIRLADGDRILVPSLGPTVAVTGLVRQPGIYELPVGQRSISARTLVALAGGEEVRGRYRFSILRILADGRSNFTALGDDAIPVRDSEILFVQLGADKTVSQATLSGSTGLAGAYPIVGGAQLSEVIRAPGALGPAPYTPFGIIVRRDPATQSRYLVAFTPVAVLNGREEQTLQSEDLIRVFSVGEMQLLSYITRLYLERLANTQSSIRRPLERTTGSTNSLPLSLAASSGQGVEFEDVSSVPSTIQRAELTALLETAIPGSELAQQQNDAEQSRQRAAVASASPSLIKPADAPTQQANLAQPDLGRNLPDQTVDVDRFASNREVQNIGQLARQLGVDPLILVNFLIDQRARLDGAIRGPGYYFIGPNVSLNELVQVAGGTINWADESGVEYTSTTIDRTNNSANSQRQTLPLKKETLANYIVHPHDKFRFKPLFTSIGAGSVSLQGEVRDSGTYSILRGDRLSDLLARAGGLTANAYAYGTVFLRQSAAQAERESYVRAADEIQSQLMIAMTRIGNDKIDPGTFSSMQTFVVELRNQRAVGRISVVADPSLLVADPSMDPLLEAGDVIYIPQRPSTIAVLGQVLQPGSFPYRPKVTIGYYLERAGGYASTANESQTFIVLPDGSARRIKRDWLNFSTDNLPPGSTIVVPRDVTPLDLRQVIVDFAQIFGQLAVGIASVAILSK